MRRNSDSLSDYWPGFHADVQYVGMVPGSKMRVFMYHDTEER